MAPSVGPRLSCIALALPSTAVELVKPSQHYRTKQTNNLSFSQPRPHTVQRDLGKPASSSSCLITISHLAQIMRVAVVVSCRMRLWYGVVLLIATLCCMSFDPVQKRQSCARTISPCWARCTVTASHERWQLSKQVVC